MNLLKPLPKFFSNIQILSGIIWAVTIIACGWVQDKSYLSTILITAAGFHVILLSRLNKRQRVAEVS